MIPNVHDPEYWVAELQPLLTDLDFAFRMAVPKAHEFFTVYHKKPINKPVLSNLIRYHALEYLWNQGFHDAKEEGEGDGWDFQRLPNNGIELLYKQSCIRVRKGMDPPYPTTPSSEDFYQQQLFEEMDKGIITNLLVLYNLDGKLQYDGKLKLMRPVRLNAKKKIVKCDWSKTFTNEFDPTQVVGSTYMHGAELPFNGAGSAVEEPEKTGSDDKK